MAKLTIETHGAQLLLDFLSDLHQSELHPGRPPTAADLQPVLEANRFFVGYYCQWTGVTPENLAETVLRCMQPAWEPAVPVLASLRRGFRRAAGESQALQARLDSLKGIDPSALAGRVTPHLPPGTPLESTLHLTLDDFNGGFQHAGEIGLSLLRDITEPGRFEGIVAHELHHVGFRYWAERDPVRQAAVRAGSARAAAVLHVQNLLAEGLAIHYCSPAPAPPPKEDRSAAAPPGDGGAMFDRYQARLDHYREAERALFAQAEQALALCLQPAADTEACRRACEGIAIDPEGIEPAGHYLGARMIEIMSSCHPHARIVECVRRLDRFLPLYNQAAGQAGAYTFRPALVEEFGRIWEEEPRS